VGDKIRNYRDLRVWQQAVDCCVEIYRATDSFPGREAFGLSSQMRRAAVSVASNVAEGFGRSNKDFARFLQMAMGSIAELETQLEIACQVGYLSTEEHAHLVADLATIGKQLNVLLQRVQAAA
jgi:four helix bundle protein